MKREDNQLNRLLKAAAAAPKPAPGAAVFSLEARVMGAWRGLRPNDDGEFLLMAFRRAAIFAGILAVGSLAWNFHARSEMGGAMAVADSVMRMGVDEP